MIVIAGPSGIVNFAQRSVGLVELVDGFDEYVLEGIIIG
jgi:hypothetical protein